MGSGVLAFIRLALSLSLHTQYVEPSRCASIASRRPRPLSPRTWTATRRHCDPWSHKRQQLPTPRILRSRTNKTSCCAYCTLPVTTVSAIKWQRSKCQAVTAPSSPWRCGARIEFMFSLLHTLCLSVTVTVSVSIYLCSSCSPTSGVSLILICNPVLPPTYPLPLFA